MPSPKPAISMANALFSLSNPNCLLSFNNPLKTSLPFNSTTLHHKPFTTTLATSINNVDYLAREFGGHGVTFTELGDSFVLNMAADNGSSAKLMLPSALITSYKPRLWHGGTLELLHTCVSEDAAGLTVQGGVSLALGCRDLAGFSWSPSTWTLKDVSRNESDGVQVEVVSRDQNSNIELQYNITLKRDSLSSHFKVFNVGSSTIELRGSLVSNLSVSTPDATYAIGLEGSNFMDRPPIMSEYSITPPEIRVKKEREDEEEEGEESSNYKHLTEKMSRIYTSAPRNFTIIDRGKRNSVEIGSRGFNEVYVQSPGSMYEWYGEYAYVCVGQTAVLKAIMLGPGEVWIGEQRLINPNI